MLCISVIIQHLLTRILTRLASRANVKIVWNIKQYFFSFESAGKMCDSLRHLLLENDVIHDVRRCNVVFTLERRNRYTVGTRSEGVWILSNMHSNKNVRIFRLSQRSEERHPKFNRLLHECSKSYSVKNWPLVFVVCSSFPIAYDF